MFNKDGKPVCRADLLKHPKLVPNFAKPSTDKMVHQTNQTKRKLASTKFNLPSCPNKYLTLLKKTATKNVLINGDKPPIHKTGFILPIACITGAATSLTFSTTENPELSSDLTKSALAIAAITGTMVGSKVVAGISVCYLAARELTVIYGTMKKNIFDKLNMPAVLDTLDKFDMPDIFK